MDRKLYVGNLPYSAGEQDLQDLFGQAGTVESVNVMRDMATGRARGFAFVEMSDSSQADQAIAALNGYQLEGRALNVNEARPKAEGDRRGEAHDRHLIVAQDELAPYESTAPSLVASSTTSRM